MSEDLMDGIVLDPKQQEAVDLCCDIERKVVGVTGPAGTGKTTIIRMVYKKLKEAGYTVALTAPTGKAAKRIYEATGIEAMTMHRLLEYSHPGDPDPKTGKPVGYSFPKRTNQNKLEFDVILADEYKMVNEELHSNLFIALPRGGVVRCFGDDNQLAPIENDKRVTGPCPFDRLIYDEKQRFPVVKLEHVFRQAEDSGILFNCQLILKGKNPTRNDQWTMDITDMSIKALTDYVMAREDEDISFSHIDNQIIVPQNKSGVGTLSLNTLLQGMYHNTTEDSMFIDRHSWVVGADGKKGGRIRVYKDDKVIITQNIYDLGVFNGETGKILSLDDDTGEILVDFGDREQVIPPVLLVQNREGRESAIDPRKSLDLAYAITTHKSQGSEYKRVVYILNKSNAWMISRRNFYTAASRAREHVHLITDQRGLYIALTKKD